MDLNPVFTSPTAFRPGGSGGELKLFEQAGIKLVHGWLVDPGSQESNALERTPDYDTAAGLIAEVDHLTNGRFVSELVVEDSSQSPGPSSSSPSGPSPPVASASSSSSSPPLATGSSQLTPEQQGKIADAIAVRDFLEHTQSQLTYHGLFQLAATLQSGELVALFRNSHLSVLLKMSSEENPFEDGGVEGGQGQVGLYTLVTDQVFLREPSVVWEKLEDVDGGWSTFVDSEFVRSSPAGGDFAGQTAEDTLKAMEIAEQQYEHMGDPNECVVFSPSFSLFPWLTSESAVAMNSRGSYNKKRNGTRANNRNHTSGNRNSSTNSRIRVASRTGSPRRRSRETVSSCRARDESEMRTGSFVGPSSICIHFDIRLYVVYFVFIFI
jgi:hypothetical protein